jgi:hypothetical protein
MPQPLSLMGTLLGDANKAARQVSRPPPRRSSTRTALCPLGGGFQCQPSSSEASPIMEVVDIDRPHSSAEKAIRVNRIILYAKEHLD